jgi:hypothetical protein
MSHSAVSGPRSDDRPIQEIAVSLLTASSLLVAHDLKLFSLLAEKSRTLLEICEACNIARRPAEALTSMCVSLGLLQLRDSRIALTPVAEDYLLETSPSYWGGALDFAKANYSLYSFESLKKAVLTNSSQVYGGKGLFPSHEEQAALARTFTRMMHGCSVGPALAWPNAVELSANRVMLDIGGGSGVHAMSAVRRWPALQAVVLDLPPVCELATEYITREGLQDSVTTHVGDMWNDPFPSADVHFYSWIYHDWPPENGRFLTEKSFRSLPSGGRLIVHELLLNDDKTGPAAVAAYSLIMLLATDGQEYSGRELSVMLAEAGFVGIEVKHTFGYWGIVTGRKP